MVYNVAMSSLQQQKVQLPVIQKRHCNGCTKCCEGWLSSTVHGHEMFPGRKCHFLEKHCTIYASRPENPCKKYECAWIGDSNLPSWLRPDISNVIVTLRIESGIKYYHVVETGHTIEAEVLNWILHWAIRNNFNLYYQVKGKYHILGEEDFYKVIKDKKF